MDNPVQIETAPAQVTVVEAPDNPTPAAAVSDAMQTAQQVIGMAQALAPDTSAIETRISALENEVREMRGALGALSADVESMRLAAVVKELNDDDDDNDDEADPPSNEPPMMPVEIPPSAENNTPPEEAPQERVAKKKRNFI